MPNSLHGTASRLHMLPVLTAGTPGAAHCFRRVGQFHVGLFALVRSVRGHEVHVQTDHTSMAPTHVAPRNSALVRTAGPMRARHQQCGAKQAARHALHTTIAHADTRRMSLSPPPSGQPGLKAGAPAALLDAQWPPSDSQPHTATHTSAHTSISTSGGHASAEEVLGAIREHRQHVEERRRRQAEEGSLTGWLARARTALTPALERLQGRGAAGEGEGQGARVVAAWAAEGEEEQGARERYPDVALSNANAYLPPPVVLARSEFLTPLDEETAEVYRRVLAASAP